LTIGAVAARKNNYSSKAFFFSFSESDKTALLEDSLGFGI